MRDLVEVTKMSALIDAPSIVDLQLDDIHEQLMNLKGQSIINGIDVKAVFSEVIDGNDFYQYVIEGVSLTFMDAYKLIISNTRCDVLI